MAYTKTTWVNNDAPYLNATNLNKIEDGIFNNDAVLNNKADTTYVDSQNTAQDNAIALKLDIDDPIFTGNLQGPYAFLDGVYIDTWVVSGTENDTFQIGMQGTTTKILIQPDAKELALTSGNLVWGTDTVAMVGDGDGSYLPIDSPTFTGVLTGGSADIDTIQSTTISTTTITGATSVSATTFSGNNVNAENIVLGNYVLRDVILDEFELYNNTTNTPVIKGNQAVNKTLELTNDKLIWDSKNIVVEDAYATDTTGGTIKIAVIGTDCYITTDGSTPGA